ncbi:MAG: hypothetical protein NT062_27835, partial [Proteobacteria bacterium]|nr:hypothetical protein [Pseudomonadota bacterium]
AIACARAIRAEAPTMLIAIATGEIADGDAAAAACDALLEPTVAALARDAMAMLFANVTGSQRPADALRIDERTAALVGPAEAIVRWKGVSYLRGHG